MRFIATAAVAAVLAVGIAASPAQAGLLGVSLSGFGVLEDDHPTLGFFRQATPLLGSPFIVGDGIEYPASGVALFTVDLSDLGILVSVKTTNSFIIVPDRLFNGFEFTAAAPLGITGVTLLGSPPAPLTASDLTVVGDTIRVNLAGLRVEANQTVSFGGTFSFAPPSPPPPPPETAVPEPASLALLGAGLAGLLVARRRRQS